MNFLTALLLGGPSHASAQGPSASYSYATGGDATVLDDYALTTTRVDLYIYLSATDDCMLNVW